MKITRDLADFAADIQYDQLPPFVVTETKRLLLDTIGCAIGGVGTEKGRLAVKLALTLGGPPEASLFGAGQKVSAASSAYATGELMNALDYEALLSPPEHATPYVLAAPLAVGEMKGISGKECILATALSHELATRFGSSLHFGNRFNVELPERGIALSIPTAGFSHCVFAGTAAAARLWGLGPDEIAHALGIAGYQAPVPMVPKFCSTAPTFTSKYLSAGFLSLVEVLAVTSAATGCKGDAEILDGPCGFWHGFGCEGWRPEDITDDLGHTWHFPDRIFYKVFPCCGAMQNALSHFQHILTERNVQPEDIVEVKVKLGLLVELPAWKSNRLENHTDAQFNVPFVFSALAHRVEIGPSWQTPETLKNKDILEFMKRVKVLTQLDEEARGNPEVEVVVESGKNRRSYTKRGSAIGFPMEEAALIEKFTRNARQMLSEEETKEAISSILGLEELEDVSKLFGLLRKKTKVD
jgi:2-methylcitrate dehydratase PrpD